ncbi:hypothetical protein GCM10009595_10280 [Falsarthrobacter nasiphocae]
MLKATKVRIYPTPEQAEFLNRQFGATRFVYNKALHIISSQYRRHGAKLRAKKDLKPLLAVAKKSRKYHWLKNFDSIALQQACINLDKAFQNFFDPKLPARYPKFKRKHGKQSSYHCMSVSVGESWIKVPKMRPIKARIHREITGAIKKASPCHALSQGNTTPRCWSRTVWKPPPHCTPLMPCWASIWG